MRFFQDDNLLPALKIPYIIPGGGTFCIHGESINMLTAIFLFNNEFIKIMIMIFKISNIIKN